MRAHLDFGFISISTFLNVKLKTKGSTSTCQKHPLFSKCVNELPDFHMFKERVCSAAPRAKMAESFRMAIVRDGNRLRAFYLAKCDLGELVLNLEQVQDFVLS